MLEDRVRTHLAQLADQLGDRNWLEADFAAADLLVISVLRRLGESDLLLEHPRLAAYVARGEAGIPACVRGPAGIVGVKQNQGLLSETLRSRENISRFSQLQ